MLLSESDVNIYNADSILNEVVLLDESESITKLPAIPVVENSRLGGEVVNLSDLDNIVEDYDCSYEDAFYNIAEQNELDPNTLAVSVEDWKLIETPELVDLVPNIVVKPISENNIVYQAVDYCINEYCNTGDEGYLDCLDEVTQDWIEKKIGGNYKDAKNDLEYILVNNSIINNPDSSDHDKEQFRKFNKFWNKRLNSPIEFNSDKERQKAKKRGIKTKDDLITYVNGLKSLTRTRARMVKKYGTPIAPDTYAKRHNSNSTNTSKTGETRKKEESKKIASNRKEEKQQAANNTASNSTNTSKALALVPGQTKTSNANDGNKQPKPFATNYTTTNTHNSSSGSFLSKHKKAIGLGAAGLIGTALVAKKIASLRKQQQQQPGLRSKLQAIINKLKSKLHK